jgi:hypothetical protein
MKTTHNQRKQDRYRVLLPARLTASHISELVRVVDLSYAGCRFMTTKNLNHKKREQMFLVLNLWV